MKEKLLLTATLITAVAFGMVSGWKANDWYYGDIQTARDLQFAKEFILYQDSIINLQDSIVLEYVDWSIDEGDYPFAVDNAFVTLNLKRK